MRLRKGITAAVFGMCLFVPLALAGDSAVDVDAVSSGNRSELVRTVPVERSPGAFVTALELKGSDLPDLEAGDRIRISAELHVTNDCTFRSVRCAGAPYKFSPRVETVVVLHSPAGEKVLATDRLRCLQRAEDRQHHCVIPFHGIEAGKAADSLGCSGGRCAVDVRLRASNKQANGSQRLVVGSNKPNGDIVQDQARLNVIRVRPGDAPLASPSHARLIENEVRPTLEKTVIFSQRVTGLDRGDVIEAWVDAKGSVAHLPYSALIGSQIVLAEAPGLAHGRTLVKRVASLDGEFNEISGTNCTRTQSPCPIKRTGVIKMREDARDQSGDRVPLYVNVVARSTAKHADARPGDAVRIVDTKTGLRVRHYETTP